VLEWPPADVTPQERLVPLGTGIPRMSTDAGLSDLKQVEAITSDLRLLRQILLTGFTPAIRLRLWSLQITQVATNLGRHIRRIVPADVISTS
jgi:hypothetical protein